MSVAGKPGIQGHLLEVTVVGCNKLKDTEWISRQDPYVCLEYGSTKFRTRTCTDGGKNPTFQEKFTFTLIEGLRELNLRVWNSNTISTDDFIGGGKVQLQKVLSQGYDDSASSLYTKNGRYAGEVKLILHYAKDNSKPAKSSASSAPSYASPSTPQVPMYSMLQAASTATYLTPDTAFSAPPSYPSYPPKSAAYPPAPYPTHQPAAFSPPYPPQSVYPPQPYPPPPQSSSYYPPGPSFPGAYPPPPY